MADETTTTASATTSAAPETTTSATTSSAVVSGGVTSATNSLLGATTSTTTSATTSAALTPEQQVEADKLAAESKTRTDAFTAAQGKDAKLAAYNALNKDEQVAAFKAMDDAAKKELGVADPSRPTYTDFKLPDGVTFDPERVKAATELFADSGLSQEQAQKFMDMHVAEVTAASQKGTQAFVDLQAKWVSEIKADPEIGGDKLTASIASAARAIDRLAIPGLKEALDLTGAGNNPSIVKAFVRIGQMVSEDRFKPGNGAPPAASKSAAERIYGDDPSKPTSAA